MSLIKEAVSTQNSPAPLPQFSQAIKYNGMVYCSGSIGRDPVTKELAKGGVQPESRVAIENLSAVLEAAGSGLDNIVKVNIFLTTMDDFAAMNQVYDEFFGNINPKPSLMSLNARARFVRVQRTHLRHAICQGSFPVSHIPPRLLLGLGQVHRDSLSQFRSASTVPQSSTSDTSLEKPLPEPISDALNPPASTRPPPLDLPARDPSTSLFTHLFRLGKAYTTFYKTGLKAVFTNRRLLRDLPDTPPPGLPSPTTSVRGSATETLSSPLDKSANPTRASLLLRARVRHDSARLPLFALVVLICGEFTPLIVLLMPRLTPYTCRIPTQADVIRRSVEARRAASIRALTHVDPAAVAKVADGHICRSLGLGSPLWDKTGFDVPWARARAAGVVGRIVQDDAMLKSGGGVRALVDDEVVLACEERGIDTLGKDVASLRSRLEAWVAKSAPSQTGDVEAALKEATDKVRRLLLGLDGPI